MANKCSGYGQVNINEVCGLTPVDRCPVEVTHSERAGAAIDPTGAAGAAGPGPAL